MADEQQLPASYPLWQRVLRVLMADSEENRRSGGGSPFPLRNQKYGVPPRGFASW